MTLPNPIKVLCICGARPNFMKIAPLMRVFNASDDFAPLLLHTGQHYDERMSDLFFTQLGIPEPDINLEVGSGTHAQQTAAIMQRFEPVLDEHDPDWVLVVGDVNSTIACALVAVKRGVKVAHVEAGLRSFDRRMPEEINRVLVDCISDKLFVTEQSGVDNLKNEGVADDKVHLVGNVMIDTLLANRAKADKSTILETIGVEAGSYIAATLHRPSNVDDEDTLKDLVSALCTLADERPLVIPVHPRTRKNLERFGLLEKLEGHAAIFTPPPLGYLDFLKLVANAAVVVTDSGGIQEETTILGVPCVTVRENTERPITLTHGTNRLVSPKRDALLKATDEALKSAGGEVKAPPMWDGKAAERIADVLRG